MTNLSVRIHSEESNDYHFFSGKSLAATSSHEAIREVVYVESTWDTDGDGKSRVSGLVFALLIKDKSQQS